MYIRTYDSLPEAAIIIRRSVFMDEQGFTNEFDDTDSLSSHLIMYADDDTPVANCRIYESDTEGVYIFGRLAVMKPYRKNGFGAAMVAAAERLLLSRGAKKLILHAQCRAEGFYKRLGYTSYGAVEDDEGCPHIWMEKSLDITFRRGEVSDFEAVKEFYYTLIDDMEGLDGTPKWKKDIYPDGEYILNSILNGEMHLAVLGADIVSAMVLNHNDESYKDISWGVSAGGDEITVIHTLAVSMKYMRCGIGTRMVKYAVRLAEAAGQKALRLDVISGNTSAMKMYGSLGFRHVTSMELYYKDTGLCRFELYEYELKQAEEI